MAINNINFKEKQIMKQIFKSLHDTGFAVLNNVHTLCVKIDIFCNFWNYYFNSSQKNLDYKKLSTLCGYSKEKTIIKEYPLEFLEKDCYVMKYPFKPKISIPPYVDTVPILTVANNMANFSVMILSVILTEFSYLKNKDFSDFFQNNLFLKNAKFQVTRYKYFDTLQKDFVYIKKDQTGDSLITLTLFLEDTEIELVGMDGSVSSVFCKTGDVVLCGLPMNFEQINLGLSPISKNIKFSAKQRRTSFVEFFLAPQENCASGISECGQIIKGG